MDGPATCLCRKVLPQNNFCERPNCSHGRGLNNFIKTFSVFTENKDTDAFANELLKRLSSDKLTQKYI